MSKKCVLSSSTSVSCPHLSTPLVVDNMAIGALSQHCTDTDVQTVHTVRQYCYNPVKVVVDGVVGKTAACRSGGPGLILRPGQTYD
jgi:hypothetical protein